MLYVTEHRNKINEPFSLPGEKGFFLHRNSENKIINRFKTTK